MKWIRNHALPPRAAAGFLYFLFPFSPMSLTPPSDLPTAVRDTYDRSAIPADLQLPERSTLTVGIGGHEAPPNSRLFSYVLPAIELASRHTSSPPQLLLGTSLLEKRKQTPDKKALVDVHTLAKLHLIRRFIREFFPRIFSSVDAYFGEKFSSVPAETWDRVWDYAFSGAHACVAEPMQRSILATRSVGYRYGSGCNSAGYSKVHAFLSVIHAAALRHDHTTKQSFLPTNTMRTLLRFTFALSTALLLLSTAAPTASAEYYALHGACLSAAKQVKNVALDASRATYKASTDAAQATRDAALAAAEQIADKAERKAAKRAAREAYKASRLAAKDIRRAEERAAKEAYEIAKANCKNYCHDPTEYCPVPVPRPPYG